jgi:hypothetical protein
MRWRRDIVQVIKAELDSQMTRKIAQIIRGFVGPLFRSKFIWLILALGTAPLKLQNYVGDLQMSSFRFDHRVEELVSRTTNAVGKALERLRETEALLKKAGPLGPAKPENKKTT